MGHLGEVLAYIEDGPHGGETVVVAAEPDGSPPCEIELQDPVPPAEPYLESSPKHSIRLIASRYRLAREAQRERGGYVSCWCEIRMPPTDVAAAPMVKSGPLEKTFVNAACPTALPPPG